MSDTNTKLAAMIWMAIDQRTPEGEATAALLALRRMEVSMDDLKAALGTASQRIIVVEKVPEFLNPEMPFGKHKGTRLSVIADEAPGYLHWLLDNTDLNPSLKTQVELALMPCS